MASLFTVLLPVTRPPHLLPCAIESVLAQSIADFELRVVCDGAPPETVACAEEFARRDARVKVLSFPKGARLGEPHRDAALADSTATYVAHIADDDLWFPDHLTELEKLLAEADFGNLLMVRVRRDGSVDLWPGDLSDRDKCRRMLEENNFFAPTQAGYRLAAYGALPQGWAPGPEDLGSDLNMWRKFLAAEDLSYATRAAVTSLKLGTPERFDATLEERGKETRAWAQRIGDPKERDGIVQAAWRSLIDKIAWKETQVAATAASCLQLDAEVRLLNKSRDDYRAALAEMTKWRDDYRAEFERMTASRDAYVGYLDAMVASRDDYRAQLDAMTTSRDDYRAQLDAMTASRDDYRAQLAAMTRARDDYAVQAGAVDHLRDEYRDEFERMKAALDAAQSEKSALAQALAAAQSDFDRLVRSRSWQVTAPLRAVRSRINRGG